MLRNGLGIFTKHNNRVIRSKASLAEWFAKVCVYSITLTFFHFINFIIKSFLPKTTHTDLKMKWKQMVPEVKVNKGRMIHGFHPFVRRNKIKGYVVSCAKAVLSPAEGGGEDGCEPPVLVPGKK